MIFFIWHKSIHFNKETLIRMDYLQISTISAIAGTFSMLLLYVYLYALYRERYMGLLIIIWTIFFLRFAFFDSRFLSWKDSILGLIAYQMIYVFSVYLFIYTFHLFINQPLRKYWLYGAVMTAIWSVVSTIMQLPTVLSLIPPTLFAGVILLFIGKMFITIKTKGIGKYITGGAFVIWGLITSMFPFIYNNSKYLWWFNLICGVSRLVIASGTLIVYFEKTRADLLKNQESLQQTIEELNHFCHSVAHDFKGPLLSINQLAEHIELKYSGKLDIKGKEYFKHIQVKSTEVINITDHLLELSRMSQKQIKMEAIALESLFREVYDELIKLQPERQIDFKIKQLPVIHGDPIMIKIMVSNILSNALKYTSIRQKGIIEVSSVEEDKDYVISIKDNGAGFDMSESSRLFKIFERLHSVKEFEGTGVGLVVCQKILKRHAGKAWLTGKEDEGAVFFFSFPKNMPKQSSSPISILPDIGELV
jgi:signal transduction histidine kinase